MNKITCDVCLDLIPLVQDGIASEDSRKAVEQHICTCQTCANIYNGKTPPDIDSTQIFKKFQKKIINSQLISHKTAMRRHKNLFILISLNNIVQ